MSPTVIAHYRVVRRLGAGGMGEVFLAEDTKLDRPVALKLLPADLAQDASRRKRLQAEAKAASALNHSHVCTIYEVGETQEGRPFIAMEYLEGQSLDVLARHRRLELRDIVKIGAQVADALEAARQHHVVHRDIKPGNIIVNAHGRAKVLDFGLAKRLDLPGEASNVTQEGATIGTPNYLSPELALGREVDSRSDIFSLGVVLYELAAGQNPFAGKVFGETVNNIINRDPPSLAPWNPTVTPEFERIVRKCLEKDPPRRYANPAVLQEELSRLQGNLNPTRFPNRAVFGTAAVAALLVGVGLFIKSFPQHASAAKGSAPMTARNTAVLPFVVLSPGQGIDELGASTAKELRSGFAEVPWIRVAKADAAGRSQATDAEQVDAVLEGSISKVDGTLQVTAKLTRTWDTLPVWFETNYCSAEGLPNTRAEIKMQVVETLKSQWPEKASLHPRKAKVPHPEAQAFYLAGLQLLAERDNTNMLNGAMTNFNSALAIDPTFAKAWAGLAESYLVTHAYTAAEARENYLRAEKEAEQALAFDPALGHAFADQGCKLAFYDYNWEDSDRKFRQAIALDQKLVIAHIWFAKTLKTRRRHEEALVQFKLAKAIDETSPIVQRVADTYLTNVAKSAEAEIRRLEGEVARDPNAPGAHLDLALIYSENGRWKDAVMHLEQAEQEGLPESLLLKYSSYLYAGAGMTNKVEEVLKKLLGYHEEGNRGDFHLHIARTYNLLGDYEQALTFLYAACDLRTTGLLHLNWTDEWAELRKHPRAQQLLRKMNLGSPPSEVK